MNKIILLILILVSRDVAIASTVSFEVKENSGVARTNDTVIYGIPFSKDENVTSTSGMSVGKDAVYTVLSRYNGAPSDSTKPIRSLLVAFQDSFSANQKKNYTLSTTGGSGSESGTNLATDNTGYVEISTGTGTFHISKTEGNLFDYASVGSDVIINEPVGDGLSVVMGGTTYSSGYSTPTVSIEANNPLYAIVKVTGQLEDSSHNPAIPPAANGGAPDSPLRFTFRHYFYKNKSYVRSFISLKNENRGWAYQSDNPIHNAYITSASIQITANGITGTKTVEIGDYSDSYSTGTYSVQQYENSASTSTTHDWQYKINGGANVAGKYTGGLSVKDSSKGLFIAERWFWENFPNKLSVTDSTVNADIFPATGSNIRLLGGSYKTHEMLYYFHNGDTSFADEIAFLRDRPVIRCTGDRYWNTQFTYGMLPATPTLATDVTFGAGESLQAAFTRYKNDARAKFDAAFCGGLANGGGPNSIQDHIAKKTIHSDGANYFNWYGWQFWGGMPRASGFGYSNQHYDWGFLAQLDFLQYGNYASKNLSEALLNHKIDYLIIHDPDGSSGWDPEYHGGQRYEGDALFTINTDYYHSIGVNSAVAGMSHFWTKDIALAYLMTGDRRYYDALEESWAHVNREKDAAWTVNEETRHQARGIDALVVAYTITGDTSYLTTAYGMFTDNLLKREGGNCSNLSVPSTCANDGISGWLTNDPGNDVDTGYDTYNVEPLTKLYLSLNEAGLTAQKTNLLNFIHRWAGWLKNTVLPHYAFGQYSSGNALYTPYSISKAVDGETGDSVLYTNIELWDMQYSAMYADIYWLTCKTVKDNSFCELAINVWKDYQFYETVELPTGPEQTQMTPKNATGFSDDTSSGDWKIAKIIHKPAYFMAEYLRDNYQGPGKHYNIKSIRKQD